MWKRAIRLELPIIGLFSKPLWIAWTEIPRRNNFTNIFIQIGWKLWLNLLKCSIIIFIVLHDFCQQFPKSEYLDTFLSTQLNRNNFFSIPIMWPQSIVFYALHFFVGFFINRREMRVLIICCSLRWARRKFVKIWFWDIICENSAKWQKQC